MKSILLLCVGLLTGCAGLTVAPVEIEHGAGMVWMDPMYERGQVPSEYQLGIRSDGVVVARETVVE